MTTISTDEAEDIVYDPDTVSQEVSRHRWYTKRLLVFKRDNALMGLYYLEPATEIQDGQDVFEADPVPIFPVVGRVVTTTRYEKA